MIGHHLYIWSPSRQTVHESTGPTVGWVEGYARVIPLYVVAAIHHEVGWSCSLASLEEEVMFCILTKAIGNIFVVLRPLQKGKHESLECIFDNSISPQQLMLYEYINTLINVNDMILSTTSYSLNIRNSIGININLR